MTALALTRRAIRPYVSTLVALWSLTACASSRAPEGAAADVMLVVVPLDSLRMERGSCFGSCLTYRVSVSAEAVRRVDSSTVAAVGDARQGRRLLLAAARVDLFTLPDVILGDTTLCPVAASDHPTVVLTAFAAGRPPKRVEHYTGCFVSAPNLAFAPAVARLAALEQDVRALLSGAPGK